MRRFEPLVNSLAANRGDAIIASLAVTPQLRARLDFTDPYYRAPARFVSRRDSVMPEVRPEYLEGKKVGTRVLVAKAFSKPVVAQFDQQIRQSPQYLARGSAVIDVGCLAAVRRRDPTKNEFLRRIDSRVNRDCAGRMAGRKIEFGRHLALRCSLAHQIGPATPAQHETKAIQQDRLASPGLASKHIQARLKLQGQPVNDQHVADFKRPEHSRPRLWHCGVRDATHRPHHIHSPLIT